MNVLHDEPQRFGEKLGATKWGGTLYELAPGEGSSYHWQVGEEEWLVGLRGAQRCARRTASACSSRGIPPYASAARRARIS